MHVPRPALLAAELVAALGIMGSRCFAVPPAWLLLDPVFVLALFWSFLAIASRTRAAMPVTLAVSIFLFVAYASRQIPFALDLLRQTL